MSVLPSHHNQPFLTHFIQGSWQHQPLLHYGHNHHTSHTGLQPSQDDNLIYQTQTPAQNCAHNKPSSLLMLPSVMVTLLYFLILLSALPLVTTIVHYTIYQCSALHHYTRHCSVAIHRPVHQAPLGLRH